MANQISGTTGSGTPAVPTASQSITPSSTASTPTQTVNLQTQPTVKVRKRVKDHLTSLLRDANKIITKLNIEGEEAKKKIDSIGLQKKLVASLDLAITESDFKKAEEILTSLAQENPSITNVISAISQKKAESEESSDVLSADDVLQIKNFIDSEEEELTKFQEHLDARRGEFEDSIKIAKKTSRTMTPSQARELTTQLTDYIKTSKEEALSVSNLEESQVLKLLGISSKT